MPNEKKLRFCLYCGSLLLNYIEGETSHCPYCGVKLLFVKKGLTQKI